MMLAANFCHAAADHLGRSHGDLHGDDSENMCTVPRLSRLRVHVSPRSSTFLFSGSSIIRSAQVPEPVVSVLDIVTNSMVALP